jgi:hypothetical protein
MLAALSFSQPLKAVIRTRHTLANGTSASVDEDHCVGKTVRKQNNRDTKKAPKTRGGVSGELHQAFLMNR